jgi:hypothetical protein
MSTDTLIEPRATATLRLFTLYVDFPAGFRARHLTKQIAASAGNDWRVRVEMWKLDAIGPVGPIRDMIAQEAGEADVLLVATSSLDQLDPAVVRWLESLVHWRANRAIPGLLIGLLAGDDGIVQEVNRSVRPLAAFARRTGMDFVWHTPTADTPVDSGWLADGVRRLLDAKKVAAAFE